MVPLEEKPRVFEDCGQNQLKSLEFLTLVGRNL